MNPETGPYLSGNLTSVRSSISFPSSFPLSLPDSQSNVETSARELSLYAKILFHQQLPEKFHLG